ncbi:MAG: hypothetical protein OES69_02345 [Myxococcales bacterium]|nr:hypothetical protein [Myxococcales bacterium]MDH3842753.1 hypothetical protein [Myxococcales bacterium]
MTKHTLNAISLTFLAMVAAACGDAGMDPFEEDLNFEEPPVDEPIVEDVIEDEEELIAPFDNDSAANPAVDEFLSITGTREVAYTDQISAEDGDNEDFVQFELPNNSNPNQRIEVAIDCDVYGDQDVFARVELLNVDGNDATRINGPPIDCNEGVSFVTVQNDQVQLARIHVQGVPQEQTLVEYTILVTAF